MCHHPPKGKYIDNWVIVVAAEPLLVRINIAQYLFDKPRPVSDGDRIRQDKARVVNSHFVFVQMAQAAMPPRLCRA